MEMEEETEGGVLGQQDNIMAEEEEGKDKDLNNSQPLFSQNDSWDESTVKDAKNVETPSKKNRL